MEGGIRIFLTHFEEGRIFGIKWKRFFGCGGIRNFWKTRQKHGFLGIVWKKNGRILSRTMGPDVLETFGKEKTFE